MFAPNQNPIDLVPEEETRVLLQPHLDTLRKCISNAWDAWIKLATTDPTFRASLDVIARAACISAHIREEVRKAFQSREDEGIRMWNKGRLFLLDIQGRILIRFKKLS